MRQDLNTLVEELQATKAAKRDYLLSPGAGHLTMVDGAMLLDTGSKKKSSKLYLPTDVFHENLSEKLRIPSQYYKRMQVECPALLDDSVNKWLGLQDKNAMVRTYEFADKSIARALLSDSYKAIDNYDVLFAALDAIKKFCKQQGVKVEFNDCGLTDRRMYVRMTCPDVAMKAPELLKGYKHPLTGDKSTYIITGLQITNSEVGQGAFQIMPRALIQVCKNGLTRQDDAFRKVHLGAKLQPENEIVWSNVTLQKNLDLIVSQVKDAVAEFLSKPYLTKTINYFTNKGMQPLVHPVQCMANITDSLGYSEERAANILDYFVKSTDYTKFGAVQALTFDAHQQDNEDLMYDAENNAFNVFEKISTFDKEISKN